MFRELRVGECKIPLTSTPPYVAVQLLGSVRIFPVSLVLDALNSKQEL